MRDKELSEMADNKSSPSSDPLPMMELSGWPMPSLYPFSAKDVVAVLGQLALALRSAFTFRRKRPLTAITAHRSLGATWHFRFLHLASFLVILPVIAATRLLPSHWHERHEQSVFDETNHTVLTALGFASMA